MALTVQEIGILAGIVIPLVTTQIVAIMMAWKSKKKQDTILAHVVAGDQRDAAAYRELAGVRQEMAHIRAFLPVVESVAPIIPQSDTSSRMGSPPQRQG